jgi:hypothetical protein
MKKTKKQLEAQIKELHQELDNEIRMRKENYRKYDDKADRMRIIGYYIQTLRVMQDKIHCRLIGEDFDRILDVLEQDRYLDGF